MITALIIVKLSHPSFTGAIENAGKKLQHGGVMLLYSTVH